VNSRTKVLLIGGNGFIGRHVAQSLRADHEVSIFDRPGSTPPEGVHFFPGDLAAGPEELLPCLDGCDTMVYLVHLAGSSPHRDPDMLALVKNLELFLQALEAAGQSGVRRVVFFSSGGAVYGIPQSIPIPEDHPLQPISAYGLCKLTMEKYLALFCQERGIGQIIIRPSNPYGPGQDFRRLQGAIAVFTHRILSGETIEIWGDGNGRKDYFSVEDLGDAVGALLAQPDAQGPFNVGCGRGFSLLEIVGMIEKASGSRARVKFRERQFNDVPEFVLDCTKIHDLTGWQPRIDLPEGLARMVAAMKTVPETGK
jgi:UDP-glucose 4-epimerase